MTDQTALRALVADMRFVSSIRSLEWANRLEAALAREGTAAEGPAQGEAETCGAELCACGHFDCRHIRQHRGAWGCDECDCRSFTALTTPPVRAEGTAPASAPPLERCIVCGDVPINTVCGRCYGLATSAVPPASEPPPAGPERR